MAGRRTVFVTGSTGMLGLETLLALSNSGRWRVVGVSRRILSPSSSLENIVTPLPLDGDWLPKDGLSSTIVHFAGLSNPRRHFDSYSELSMREIVPQVHMVEKILRAGWHGHLIYMSSGGVYGDVERMPVAESHTCKPKGYYALHKLAIEQALLFLATQYEFKLTILRTSNPYGSRVVKREQGVIPMLVSAALNDMPFTMMGDGTGLRDYLHITDFTRALACVLDAQGLGQIETLNLGSGTGTSLSDLIHLVNRLSGRTIRVCVAPAPFEVNSNILDISKAKSLLDWVPDMPLELGVSSMIGSYLDQVSPT